MPLSPVIRFTDSANNRLTVQGTNSCRHGERLIVCRLINDPDRGYVAVDDGRESYGNDKCPDGPPVCGWFGRGERYKTPEELLAAIRD